MKKIIIIFLFIVLFIFFCILFLVSNNNKYINSIEKDICDNYDIKDDIIYVNKSHLYYIILTSDYLIVLDDNYKEIFKDDVNNIVDKKDNYEIVYRLNKVMYEEKKVLDKKIIYNYYDIYTNECIDTVEVGG